jgi:hypothetical protein
LLEVDGPQPGELVVALYEQFRFVRVRQSARWRSVVQPDVVSRGT